MRARLALLIVATFVSGCAAPANSIEANQGSAASELEPAIDSIEIYPKTILILDDRYVPLSGAWLQLMSPDGPLFFQSNDDGRVTTTPLEAGAYAIEVWAPCYNPTTMVVEFEDYDDTTHTAIISPVPPTYDWANYTFSAGPSLPEDELQWNFVANFDGYAGIDLSVYGTIGTGSYDVYFAETWHTGNPTYVDGEVQAGPNSVIVRSNDVDSELSLGFQASLVYPPDCAVFPDW